MIEEKMYRTWFQIGEKLGCKSSLVAFEPINEPPAETAEHGAELNNINEIFLQALADSGGFNTQRVVTLVGGGMDSIKTSQWFEAPAGFDNPWAIQYHYYSPCESASCPTNLAPFFDTLLTKLNKTTSSSVHGECEKANFLGGAGGKKRNTYTYIYISC